MQNVSKGSHPTVCWRSGPGPTFGPLPPFTRTGVKDRSPPNSVTESRRADWVLT